MSSIDDESNYNIYILELNENKYYIGKTKNPSFRIDEHFNQNGSEWTKKYKPIKILENIQNCDSYDEDKYVIKYMKIYGIENVRGGSFSKFNLSDSDIGVLNKMIKGATDKCFKCGASDHFIKNCKEAKLCDILNANIKLSETLFEQKIPDENDEFKRSIINYTDRKYKEIKSEILFASARGQKHHFINIDFTDNGHYQCDENRHKLHCQYLNTVCYKFINENIKVGYITISLGIFVIKLAWA